MKRIDGLEFPTPYIASVRETHSDYIKVVLPKRWRRNDGDWDYWLFSSATNLLEPKGHELVTFRRVNWRNFRVI